jgi:hypothetical protein
VNGVPAWEKKELPGGESNPALARSVGVTGACTNPIYYQGLNYVALYYINNWRIPSSHAQPTFHTLTVTGTVIIPEPIQLEA